MLSGLRKEEYTLSIKESCNEIAMDGHYYFSFFLMHAATDLLPIRRGQWKDVRRQ